MLRIDIHHWFTMAPKMVAKIQNPPIWAKFGFQVDFVLAN
jgi:hypothetical protein